MLLSRRRIGPAYEVTPAEHVGRWLRDHLLRVIAALVAIFLFCWTADWIVIRLMNFLAAERAYNDDETARFSGADPILVGVRIVGSLVLGYFFLFRFKVHPKF